MVFPFAPPKSCWRVRVLYRAVTQVTCPMPEPPLPPLSMLRRSPPRPSRPVRTNIPRRERTQDLPGLRARTMKNRQHCSLAGVCRSCARPVPHRWVPVSAVPVTATVTPPERRTWDVQQWLVAACLRQPLCRTKARQRRPEQRLSAKVAAIDAGGSRVRLPSCSGLHSGRTQKPLFAQNDD